MYGITMLDMSRGTMNFMLKPLLFGSACSSEARKSLCAALSRQLKGARRIEKLSFRPIIAAQASWRAWLLGPALPFVPKRETF